MTGIHRLRPQKFLAEVSGLKGRHLEVVKQDYSRCSVCAADCGAGAVPPTARLANANARIFAEFAKTYRALNHRMTAPKLDIRPDLVTRYGARVWLFLSLQRFSLRVVAIPSGHYTSELPTRRGVLIAV